MSWSRDKFLLVLAAAHKAERQWVEHRRDEGLAVAHGKKEVLLDHNPKTDHCLNPDCVGAVNIELKLRNLEFTGPHDWPHPTVFVDDMYGLTKGHYPFAWVYISKPTGSWVWLSALDMDDNWTEQVVWDGMRKFSVPTLVCPKSYLRHADSLRDVLLPADLLRRIEGASTAFRNPATAPPGASPTKRERRPPRKDR